MRSRLRTLLIVLALGPVALAGAWWLVFQTPAEYIRSQLRDRQHAAEYWDRKYPGWREHPEIVDRSDPIPLPSR